MNIHRLMIPVALMLLTACAPVGGTILQPINPQPTDSQLTQSVPRAESRPGTSPTTCSLAGEEQADAQTLQETYGLSEEMVLRWYCAGAGIGDIRRAYEIHTQSGKPIETIFEQFFAGVGWGEINRADEETPERSLDPAVQSCVAEHGNHQEAQRIAATFTQPVDLISRLFCEGLGFGEIRNALTVHAETDVPLDEIIARFRSGESWATIRAELDAAPLQGDPTGND